jgi:cell division protein FtsB
VIEEHRIILWVGVGVMALCLFGNEGFRHFVTQAREKHRLGKVLLSARAEHERLSGELALIQKDPSYTEYLIRKNLGYVKKGEVEYRFVTNRKDR